MQTTNGTTQEVSTMEATIDRYLTVWNEADPAARAELVYDVVTDDARLVDPLVDATGPDGIAVAITGLRDQMPGHSLTRTTAVDAHHDTARFGWTVNAPDGSVDAHHDTARFGWTVNAPDGSVAVAGIDVVTFAPDGRVQSAVGFFGELTPVG